jgi:SAM-dependent methyltransferase
LGDDPSRLGEYHRALASYARHDYRRLAEAVDFGIHACVLDAGGGTGELTFALLRAFPTLAGVVMDRPEVLREAEVPEEIAGRCSFIAGDLFSRWPVESDAVVLARVLHDWPDGDAARILERAREAMPAGGCLYVVEMALDESAAAGLLDLNMLVTTGGAERSARQFHALLAGAGFEMLDVAATDGVSSIIRARAA